MQHRNLRTPTPPQIFRRLLWMAPMRCGCLLACDANYGLVDVSSEEGLLFFSLTSAELSAAAVLNDILSLAIEFELSEF